MLPASLRGTGPVALAFLAGAFLVGVLASSRAEREFGHDAGPIVFDEVVGQWVSLAGLPLTPATLVASFVLFRAFDVLKPFPAGRSQSLPGGLGIMTDDLFAGLWAQVALRAALHFLGSAA
jgi:phosphatidylglycerophosphatase A